MLPRATRVYDWLEKSGVRSESWVGTVGAIFLAGSCFRTQKKKKKIVFIEAICKDRDIQSLPNDDQPGLSVFTLPTPPS
jgi:hypothetical protein